MQEVRETIYEHQSGESVFTVSTQERAFISMLRKLKERRPEEVEIIAENSDGSLVAKLPVTWMKIRPPRTVNMSEEQRAAASERMRKIIEDKKKNRLL